jgi:transcriptional regulator NrdR family protein
MRFCPNCGQNSSVIDCRIRKDGGVRRRRKCDECGHAWNTIEFSESEFERLLKMQDAFRVIKELL